MGKFELILSTALAVITLIVAGTNLAIGQQNTESKPPGPSVSSVAEIVGKIEANLRANTPSEWHEGWFKRVSSVSVGGGTLTAKVLKYSWQGSGWGDEKKIDFTLNLSEYHNFLYSEGTHELSVADSPYVFTSDGDFRTFLYDPGPNKVHYNELVDLEWQLKAALSLQSKGSRSSSLPSELGPTTAGRAAEAGSIQRLKRPMTNSQIAGATTTGSQNLPASTNSTDPPINTVVDSGMLYKSQAGLKVAYSTIYLGKDSCGKKYKVNVTINNGEPTNVNVLASRVEIDSDYDGFESNASDCNLGDPYYLFGSSPQYAKWTILAKGFSATSSHVLYMKSPTAFPHITANIVPRSDTSSTNVSRSNNGSSAESVAQSAGIKLVDSGVLYKSENGLIVGYSTVYLGSDTCGKKYRVTISIRNGASSKINVLGSRVDIDSDYDGFEPNAGACNLGSPYYLFGSSPGFQGWKVLDPGFSDSNSHLIYMKSPSAFPKISASILAKSPL